MAIGGCACMGCLSLFIAVVLGVVQLLQLFFLFDFWFWVVVLRAGSFSLWFVPVLFVPALVLLIAWFGGSC